MAPASAMMGRLSGSCLEMSLSSARAPALVCSETELSLETMVSIVLRFAVSMAMLSISLYLLTKPGLTFVEQSHFALINKLVGIVLTKNERVVSLVESCLFTSVNGMLYLSRGMYFFSYTTSMFLSFVCRSYGFIKA